MTTSATTIVNLGARRARSFGAASLAELVSNRQASERACSRAEARRALAGAGAEFLERDWFWLPSIRRDRLTTLTRRMLAVNSPLAPAMIRDGLCRVYRRSEVGLLAPTSILGLFYRAHADFDLDERGRVRPLTELDHRRELGSSDRVFVAALRASWIGVLDDRAFRAACRGEGMTDRAFRAAAARSAILARPGSGAWCLRGAPVSAITLAARRHALGSSAGFDREASEC